MERETRERFHDLIREDEEVVKYVRDFLEQVQKVLDDAEKEINRLNSILIEERLDKAKHDMFLWDALKKHVGHNVEIAVYGDLDNPASVTLEDMDTNEIILDAEIYTICPRED